MDTYNLPARKPLNHKSTIAPWIILIAAFIWDFIIPSVPVIGWLDDTFITLFAGLNFLQSTLGDTNIYLVKILRLAKWICFGMGIIIFLLVALLGTLLVKLIKGL